MPARPEQILAWFHSIGGRVCSEKGRTFVHGVYEFWHRRGCLSDAQLAALHQRFEWSTTGKPCERWLDPALPSAGVGVLSHRRAAVSTPPTVVRGTPTPMGRRAPLPRGHARPMPTSLPFEPRLYTREELGLDAGAYDCCLSPQHDPFQPQQKRGKGEKKLAHTPYVPLGPILVD